MKPSPAPTPAPLPPVPSDAPPTRPTRVDYFLMLLGFALSFYLVELSGYQAREPEHAPAGLAPSVLRPLPTLLFLQVGPVLFWPVFYTTQRLAGRPAALTPGEWLWGVAWLTTVALVVWVGW